MWSSPGDRYPEFNLADQDGQPFAREDVAGRWFLAYWYPMADTPGCTAQATGLRDQIEVFDEVGCTVIGISFDVPEVNGRFRFRYRIPFPLLSDTERELAVKVGAASDADSTYARRVAHLVGPDGLIARTYEVEDPEFFAEVVLDDLEDLTE